MPYPRRLLWDILPQNTPNSQNLLLRCPPTDFTDLQILRVRCSPTEFTEFTEFGSVGMAGMPYPPTSVRIRAHLWEVLLCQKFPCVPCVLWEYLFSHGFHRFTQILRVRCSPTEFTESTEFVSVGMAGMPYPPNLCSSVSSVGGSSLPEVSVRSVRSVGISFLPRISQIYTDTYGALFSHRIHRIWQRGYGRNAIPS